MARQASHSLFLIGLAACSSVDAAAPPRELFTEHVRLPCWTTRPHVATKRIGDLACHVDATAATHGVRAARLVCNDVRGAVPSIARPMLDGWFLVERGLGAWHLGYGKDRARPVLPTFGWQQESPISNETLGWLRKDGPDYPEKPAPRAWESWENDDHARLHRTRDNTTSFCTQTRLEGLGGLTTRHDVCWTDGKITGASVSIFQGWLADPRCERRPTTDPLCDRRDPRVVVDEPEPGWTMQTRCGDAPFLYDE